MSISRRFINIARSELNALLEKAADREGDDAVDDNAPTTDNDAPTPRARRSRAGAIDLSSLTDDELTAEIERRHRAAQAPAQPRGAGTASASSSSSTSRPSRTRSPADPVRAAYNALEVPVGSDFDTVKKSYRALMRKYHPDRHIGSPEKQKTANELTQKLSEAYRLLETRLRR